MFKERCPHKLLPAGMTIGVALFAVLIAAPALAAPPPEANAARAPAAPGAAPAAPGGTLATSGDLAEFIQLYSSDRGALDSFYNLPWSETRLDRLQRFYTETRDRLADVDFAALNQQGRIDYVLLRGELTAELKRLDRERRNLAEIDDLLPFRKAALELELGRRRMEPLDPPAAAAKLASFGELLRKVRERIEQGRQAPPPPAAPAPAETSAPPAAAPAPSETAVAQAADANQLGPEGASAAPAPPATKPATGPLRVSPATARRAAGAVDALHNMLREWYGFYDGFRPDFSWWVKKPHDEVGAALDDYARYLRETVGGFHGGDDDPLVGEPIGADALADDLATEFLAYNPDELIAIGERELAWCEEQMKVAAAEMGFADDWKAALAKVKEDYVPPGQQADTVSAQALEVIRLVKDRDLLTVPPICEESWRVSMIGADAQKVLPFAAYGGQNIMVAYATEAMKNDDKLMAMRGNNRHVTRVFVAHELIPGHHLQAFQTQRHRPYRGIFSTPFFVEGWALYWEMTLWDKGYSQTPEDRMGMLFWRMHRAARVIVSLKFQLGRQSAAEMIDFLVQRVGHERFGATGEVRRFIGDGYSPLYQCGYLIGGLQMRALRKELVDSGKMGERQFHDALLSYGAIPVELIRAGLLDLPLHPGTQAGWKFAGESAAP